MSEERNIEPSSQRRRQLIRERGIPRSVELTTALSVIMAAQWLRSFLPELDPTQIRGWLAVWLTGISVGEFDAGQGGIFHLQVAGIVCGRVLAGAWLLCLCCVTIQGGWTWRSAIGRSGGQRATSPMPASPRWWTTVISTLKLLLLPALLATCLYRGGIWQSTAAIDSIEPFRNAADWVLSSVQFIASGWLALGVVDYALRIWIFRRSLRWTPAEWREELKRLEGRPALRRLPR